MRTMRLSKVVSLSHAMALATALATTMAAGAAQAADDVTLKLPPGFKATVFYEGQGNARHIAIAANGDVYINGRNPGLVALRDTNKDGKADVITPFGDTKGTEIRLYKNYVYASDDVGVYRYALKDGELAPSGAKEVVVGGFPEQRGHTDKTFALSPEGQLYVNVGAPSNACQEQDRQKGSPALFPCKLLATHGGVWQYDGNKTGQKREDGKHFSTGIRNAVAIEWNTVSKAPYIVMHGRDSLDTLFPELYTAKDNATRQAEEFHRLTDGGNFGWPYTFWDNTLNKRVVGPEYGGDGKKEPKEKYPEPLVAFPAHYAPNDLLFYTGSSFPAQYKNGAFIAFHGSWNRAPEPQAGYNVVFQPMKDGKPNGKWEVFADGFAGELSGNNPRNATHRPVGLAVAPDGSLFVADSQKGRIWRISYSAN
jgi:glucose/arabinose dehydrogenase